MSFNIAGFEIEDEFEVEETLEDEIDLSTLTVVELKEIAKEKGIKGYSNMTKQQLIDAINETPQEVFIFMVLEELKEWLKIEHEDEDTLLSSLLTAAKADIESSTGVKEEHLADSALLELYNMAIRVWVTFMYEHDPNSDKGNSMANFERVMNNFYLKLEAEYLKLKRVGKI